MLPPSAIAGVSVVCALGPWVFTEQTVLRALAAAAAVTAVLGAVVLRRWDTQAGKQVADLTRARASDEWRYEERVAELETDLEESRELRVKLEQRLRAKRTELAGLRNEHAALLRRYATAETERATALEGRRLLEIETTAPTPALLPAPATPLDEAGAVAAPVEAAEAERDADVAADSVAATDGATDASEDEAKDETETPAVFSPAGSKLFLRAKGALARFGDEGDATVNDATVNDAEDGAANDEQTGEPRAESQDEPDADPLDEPADEPEAASGPAAEDEPDTPAQSRPEDGPAAAAATGPKVTAKTGPRGDAPKGEPVKVGSVEETAAGAAGGTDAEAAQEDETRGKPVAADGHERAAATTPAKAAQPGRQPSGHFVAPTAVAVAPASPSRRPHVEGGFDFFGTQKGAAPAALAAVQNEDLADVVGQEALALHKAESEAEFKPADEGSRGIGQVIDLTAHDETEQIDVQVLRSAVS
ncbi:hypothetical protein AQJ84_14825 [Streptomyces resistomycificus]|uniref:Secreted protein n=2 Tax=Streptomyces resistomycificus TaxID=67356 RepID=A0A0L8LAX9_9ACTN|nr:hypothetical protein [Streptomyces resistomycificus]KOG35418.1 hypothetical protein ADK37_15310 [Streptomyces resistomycificus]KUN98337.1 hypothetical protein AQJ84_14825 [Streptomyces resistomycificus]